MSEIDILKIFDSSLKNLVKGFNEYTVMCGQFYSQSHFNLIITFSNLEKNYNEIYAINKIDLGFLIRENLRAQTSNIYISASFETYAIGNNTIINPAKFRYESNLIIHFHNSGYEIKSPLKLEKGLNKLTLIEIEKIIKTLKKEHLTYILNYEDENENTF